jgi:hypothetical protein
MRRSGTRIALIVTESFAALSAIGGGIALATGIDKPPTDWLAGTPFSNYMIPGLILAVVVGGSAIAGTITSTEARVGRAEATGVAWEPEAGWDLASNERGTALAHLLYSSNRLFGGHAQEPLNEPLAPEQP